MKPSEKQIRDSIIQFLNMTGNYWVWKVNTGGMERPYKGKLSYIQFNTPGTPDIQGIQNKTGRFIALEVKTPERKNRTTRAQEEFLFMVNTYGGIGAVVTSIDDVREALGE